MSRLFDELRMARSTNSTGFIVGCSAKAWSPERHNDGERP
jgi:hypothetical protein